MKNIKIGSAEPELGYLHVLSITLGTAHICADNNIFKITPIHMIYTYDIYTKKSEQ